MTCIYTLYEHSPAINYALRQGIWRKRFTNIEDYCWAILADSQHSNNMRTLDCIKAELIGLGSATEESDYICVILSLIDVANTYLEAVKIKNPEYYFDKEQI